MTLDENALFAALDDFRIELPSWAFNNSGTRFHVFEQPGAPADAFAKVDDAATVHRYTGAAPLVSLHIPWDAVADYRELAAHAVEQGLAIGAINSNTFQDDAYRLGSLAHPDAAVRRKALAAVMECGEIAAATGAHAVKVWLGDGTNYPGQDSFRLRLERLEAGFREIHDGLPDGVRLLIEYKLYEPAFYATDVPDWGTALLLCERSGPNARVVVDLGHHAAGVNIEQIVAVLLSAGRLGAFDLNDRKHGDDDLIAGSINPYQLFLVFAELAGVEAARGVSYMVDQAHNIEPKVPALIRTVMTLQEQWAKAVLIDRTRLECLQAEGDVLGANAVVKDAYDTDVRPLLARWRERHGLAPDPFNAYLESGDEARRRRR
ncbi:MAG TPA: TIM barrel protein [Candidatus Dormibacteraeota bacterium]